MGQLMPLTYWARVAQMPLAESVDTSGLNMNMMALCINVLHPQDLPLHCLFGFSMSKRLQAFQQFMRFAYESYLRGVSSSTEQMVSVDSKEIRFHTVTVRETKLLHSNSISK